MPAGTVAASGAARPLPPARLSPDGHAFRFFSPSSFWNVPLAAGAALDPSSGAVLAAFEQEVLEEGPAHHLNVNTISYSVPIYTVPADQPTLRVRLEKGPGSSANPLQRAWRAVPLPADAQPARGSDKHLVVWQPSTDRMWEFWAFENTSAGPVARWGGAMRRVSQNKGVYDASAWRRVFVRRAAWQAETAGWGATGTSLPVVGGLITLEDLRRGRIEHALAMAVPNARADVWATPAHRTDGTSSEATALPEGARLRLDPSLDIAALHLPHFVQMLAEAAQRYGIVIRDKSANITFYAQDPIPTGTDPYVGRRGYFEGRCACGLLERFPWDHLQLLRMRLYTKAGPVPSARALDSQP